MDSLNLGRLNLPLAPGPGGPLLAGLPPCPAALAAVVNGHRCGLLKDLTRVLESGDRASLDQAVSVVRPYPEDDLESLAGAWEALTGLPAGDDVYVLRASWERQRFLMPRLALMSLLKDLEVRRPGSKRT
ncbi:MAG: hypothetical protein KF833_04375 [Verrucomicrobiae bacterium]|nr:hypothetical protein [Verrucomicrobiae bacterium]